MYEVTSAAVYLYPSNSCKTSMAKMNNELAMHATHNAMNIVFNDIHYCAHLLCCCIF